MNRKKHLALACMALAVGLTVGSAGAAPIAIANFNFEAVPVPDWYWVPDWDEGGASYVADEEKAAAEGWSGAGRVLYMDAGGWVSQNLGYNWTAGEVFTLGIKGNQGWRSGGSFKIQLRQADATVLWDSGTIPVTSTVSNFTWTIASSMFSGAGGTPGSQLNIRIECLANTVDLDDVTLSASADDTPPALASSNIVDDKSGGSVNPGQLVTYTVTFNKDMDASTVSASDFGNAGTAAVTIGTVTETTPASGVFIVPVTATGAGPLQLKVNAGAVLNDAVGNALDTASAILDDTTITVVDPPGNTGSGGTITYTDSNGSNAVANTPYIGGYVVHTFTNSGTLYIPVPASADVLVVAGGGGGGGSVWHGAGGGAGGLIYSNGYTVVGGSNYTVTVGAGGAALPGGSSLVGKDGSNSWFGPLLAYGGGGGGTYSAGRPGGSGGGAVYTHTVGTGVSGQGHAGGSGNNAAPNFGSGGGGGAGTNGVNGTSISGGNGGDGRYFAAFANWGDTNNPGWFAGGGGGGTYVGGTSGLGGKGGGGNNTSTVGTDGQPNTGGGGGGPRSHVSYVSGAGGSGIVIVKYPYTPPPPRGTLISFF
jgi:hypothetical protein